MTEFLLLLLGLAGLWFGTEIAIRAALRIADRFGLSQMFVGMTILAVGTDVPEFVLAVVAGIQRVQGTETSGLVVGSAVGSCIAQITIVLGVAGILGFLTIGGRRIWMEGVMLLGSIAIFALVAMDGTCDRTEGGLLLTSYLIYYLILLRRERMRDPGKRPVGPESGSVTRDVFACILGLTLVALFSWLTITNAVAIAELWGVGQSFVGLVIVGLGTSLPELALSINAVFKHAGALSVGNVLGSNVFDVLVPTGAAALIGELSIPSERFLWVDVPTLAVLSLIALLFFVRGRGLQKLEAWALIMLYLAYVTAQVVWR